MSFIIKILKGVVIGIANVIPGVSGGTMMVSMGIYDKIIGSVNNLFKDFKKSIMTLLPYLIGMLIGIAGFSVSVEWLFSNFPLQTALCFVGLIFGGLPVIFKYAFKKEHKKDFGPLSVILFIVFFGIVLFQTFFKSTRGDVNLTINIGTVILLLVLGLIASATMIIPGVSGSMMLMTLGYYNPVISTVSSFVKALLKWNVKQLFHDAGILIPFGIGVIAGILLMAKLIEFLLKKYELNTYMAILGLVLASPFAILAGIGFGVVNALSVITGIVTFAIGFVAALFLSKE